MLKHVKIEQNQTLSNLIHVGWISDQIQQTKAIYMSHDTTKHVFGVSDQARHKPACTDTEASLSLEISAIESRDILLSKQQTTKAQISLHIQALIRLRGCAGWSAPLLFAYHIRHIFSWPGSYVKAASTNLVQYQRSGPNSPCWTKN